MFGEQYRGRRVLVTGHTGFKGSWLTAWLLGLGAEVTGYALEPPTVPSLFDALGLERHIRHEIADVRDVSRLAEVVEAARPEIVLHLAAQPLVREGYAIPRETFETNVMGTVNLLDVLRSAGDLRAAVIVTTDKCYRNLEDGSAFVEDDALGGRDPYSASKGCAELATAAYAASFYAPRGVGLASARAGNVIGGGDWAADRLVPDCVRALTEGRAVVVRNPDAVRPWQHVLEPLAGYLWLAAWLAVAAEEFGGAWNFGPDPADHGLPVRWVVERLFEAWGAGEWAASGAEGEPHEAHLLQLDSTKAREQLEWAPIWGAQEAVRRTAVWYRGQYEDAAAAPRLVQEDIEAYQGGARLAGTPWASGELGRIPSGGRP
jgi:CDP-glucose 4,6-dehydratase